MAKHCKATACYRHCSTIAHKGGKEQCPSNNGWVPKSCPACKGGHAAFNRRYLVVRRQWDIVKANYISWPKTFIAVGNLMEAWFTFRTTAIFRTTATAIATRSIEE